MLAPDVNNSDSQDMRQQKFLESAWPMLAIVLAFGLFNFFFGEKILLNEGLGWDGARYAEMVRRLPEMIHLGELNTYYAQRVAPLFVVRALMLLAGVSLAPSINIIHAFEIYNLALLLLTCWLWHSLMTSVGLESRWRWFGFLSLFFSYEAAKQGFYYPVLTDITALLISVLLLRFYLSSRPFAILVTTVVGAFVWPFATVVGACLILLPRAGAQAPVANVASRVAKRPYTLYLWCGLAVVMAACGAVYAWLSNQYPDAPLRCNVPDVITTWFGGPTVTCTWSAFVTGIPSVLLMAAASLTLLVMCVRQWSVGTLWRAVSLYRVVLAVAAGVVPYVIVKLISNPALQPPSGIRALLEFMLLPPAGKFLLPFVTLGVFWGPMFLILMLRWTSASRALSTLGPGIAVSVALSLPLGLANEPRFLTLSWPFCIIGGLFVLRELDVGRRFATLFGALVLLTAQFWLPLNRLPWEPIGTPPKSDALTTTYFMHYGLWMEWFPYVAQGICIVVAMLWLNALMRKKTASTAVTGTAKAAQ